MLKAKGDDRTDQQKTGAFLKALRKEKNLTQEQLAERFSVTGRTVSRWETGVNLPDLPLLVELADYYNVDIRELIDGERKSEKMEPETKETLLKVSDYTEADKKQSVKKAKRRLAVCIAVPAALLLLIAAALNFLFGNPVSKAMAVHNAETILTMRFGRGEYEVKSAGYWIEDSEYFVSVYKPGSPDSHYVMNFGMFGNYRYDDYERMVLHKQAVFDRMDREYREIVQPALKEIYGENDADLGYGAVLTGDPEENENVSKIKRLQEEQVELDQIFDYKEIGREYGEVVLLLEDTDLSAERLAEELMKLKTELNARGVYFQSVSLSITDRSSSRRGEGSGLDVVGVWHFPAEDIREPGLAERVTALK